VMSPVPVLWSNCMTYLLSIFVAVAVILLLVLMLGYIRPLAPQPQATLITIERIREHADLTVLSLEQSLILTRHLSGVTGGVKACVVVVGHIRIASDLSQAVLKGIDRSARTATLILPQPVVEQVELDPNKIQVYAVDRTGLWKVLPFPARESDIIMQTMQDASKELAASIRDEHLQQAREHTQQAINSLYQPLNWTVKIQWQEQ